jgi:hypothetical protein
MKGTTPISTSYPHQSMPRTGLGEGVDTELYGAAPSGRRETARRDGQRQSQGRGPCRHWGLLCPPWRSSTPRRSSEQGRRRFCCHRRRSRHPWPPLAPAAGGSRGGRHRRQREQGRVRGRRGEWSGERRVGGRDGKKNRKLNDVRVSN